jgi:hypothetical protein
MQSVWRKNFQIFLSRSNQAQIAPQVGIATVFYQDCNRWVILLLIPEITVGAFYRFFSNYNILYIL